MEETVPTIKTCADNAQFRARPLTKEHNKDLEFEKIRSASHFCGRETKSESRNSMKTEWCCGCTYVSSVQYISFALHFEVLQSVALRPGRAYKRRVKLMMKAGQGRVYRMLLFTAN